MYAFQRPPYEVRQVRLGMTMDEAMNRLGMTPLPMLSGGAGGGQVTYVYDWGRLTMHFSLDESRCTELSYYLKSDERWYRAHDDGSFAPST